MTGIEIILIGWLLFTLIFYREYIKIKEKLEETNESWDSAIDTAIDATTLYNRVLQQNIELEERNNGFARFLRNLRSMSVIDINIPHIDQEFFAKAIGKFTKPNKKGE